MNKKSFKVDDWVYYEFELVQIREIEDGKITKISDGMFNTWSTDLTPYCFSMDMDMKKISDYVKSKFDDINEINLNCLNHPSIKHKFVDYWVEMCENYTSNYDKYVTEKTKFETFYNEVITTLTGIKSLFIDGVKIIR
jgi:hypothetical protein